MKNKWNLVFNQNILMLGLQNLIRVCEQRTLMRKCTLFYFFIKRGCYGYRNSQTMKLDTQVRSCDESKRSVSLMKFVIWIGDNMITRKTLMQAQEGVQNILNRKKNHV